ncbi:MAG: histidine kinase [Oscillospiraceae bacterium]
MALTLVLCLVLTGYVMYNRSWREREEMTYLAETLSSETYEIMLAQLSKTRVLESILIQTGGDYRRLGGVTDMLLKDDYVRNVLFAPGGVVAAVYPAGGNESVLGLDMSAEGAGNLEARAAIEEGELYMAGPFELVQGGLGIAGRLPVYLEDAKGTPYFWGIVSVTLDFPEVLSTSSIHRISGQGFACELWRTNPDTGLRQTVLCSDSPLPAGRKGYDYPLPLFNSDWTVSIAPLTPWYAQPSLWLMLLGSLLVSTLVGFVLWNMAKVRQMKTEESARQILDLRSQLEREQTNMLLSQISSHFFYHTLNSLQALIILQPKVAYKMSGDFSRYLRFSIDSISAEGGVGTFKEELRAVRAYADINQQQLGDRLRMVYHIAEEDFAIPLLTIQPIVENAILHGIKPKPGGGTITISVEKREGGHVITIEDDGVGFDTALLQESQSVGLTNVRRRIAQFPDCSIQIESKPGAGTKVVLNYQTFLQISG